MSILIKGIDLPNKGDILTLDIYSDGHGYASHEGEADTMDAEAIQIPTPHGRLIDGDKIVKEYYSNPTYPYLCTILNNAPTILEAEE